MSGFIEVIRAFPVLSLILIGAPLVGGLASGLIGVYLGYDNLQQRLERTQQADRVNNALNDLRLPVETIRRYETQLATNEQHSAILRRIVLQYDQLKAAIELQSKFTGRENSNGRIAAADQILGNIRELLGATKTISGPNGGALIINTAPNVFMVMFAVPMRIAPSLEFRDLPAGVVANIIEKSNIGFTVIFSPQTISVRNFNFIASAEL